MSDFLALHVALSGLQAARARMDVASNNVANVATSGYTRQRVDLAPKFATQRAYGMIGTGVDVLGVSRARDAFLDARVRAAHDQLAAASVRSELLSRAELTLAEPEQGLTAPLADLWAAFEDLATSPTSSGARIATLSALDAVASRIRTIATGWQSLERDASDAFDARVGQVNDLLRSIGDVNRAITAAPDGTTRNDLLDRRDNLLDEVASKLGATVAVQDDGTARVTIGGMALVDAGVVNELSVGAGYALLHPLGVSVPSGGEIGGYARFLTTDLTALRAGLDAFTEDLADALNVQHQAGWVSNTQPGGALLTYSPGNAAATVVLAFNDPALLAVSSDPGPPFPTFNAQNAQALASLRTAAAASGGTDTLDGAARALATDLGARVADAARAARTQLGIAGATELARQAQHGVSLDEELTELMSAQHAYQAAARVMTAVDEALGVLINRTGVVGR